MPSMSTQQVPETSMDRKRTQLSRLCVLYKVLTNYYKEEKNIEYGSYEIDRDVSLPPFHRFLGKIAQILHTEQGGDTISSVCCLVAEGGGAEILFTSNFRKVGLLDQPAQFLRDLLGYAATNPDELKAKPLQRQVQGRILKNCLGKVELYVRVFVQMLRACIEECDTGEDSTDFDTASQLRILESKATFSMDMTGSNSADKVLSDFDSLLKAIEATKNGSLNGAISRRAMKKEPKYAYKWCQLRHCMGRIYSYRQASEIIAAAPKKWPELFKSFKITPIKSGKRTRSTLSGEPKLQDLIEGAFPEATVTEYTQDIQTLRQQGLDDMVVDEMHNHRTKMSVHAEVKMHEHLTRVRQVTEKDFWDGSMFIATSKPTCQLCHYYFQATENEEFSVQSSHMNLYRGWRLPDTASEDVLDEVIESMQQAILKLLKEKLPHYRRNDSRTDSWVNTRQSMRTDSRGSGVLMGAESGLDTVEELHRSSTELEDEDYEDYGTIGSEKGFDNALNGGAYIPGRRRR